METKVYNPTTCPVKNYRRDKPVIRVTSSNIINFGLSAQQILNLIPESRISFHQDIKHIGDWYVAKTSDGYTLRKIKNSLAFSCKNICDRIKESLNLNPDKGFHLSICKEPVQKDEFMLYGLIHKPN